MKNWLLYSGGYDSTVLLYELVQTTPNLDIVHIVTNYNEEETKWARYHKSKLFGMYASYTEINVPLSKTEDEYIPFRNTNFIFNLLSNLTKQGDYGIIYLGLIKVEEPFIDCTEEWLEALNTFILIENKGIQVLAPYINYTKNKVFQLGNAYGVKLKQTFSCNFPKDGKECGECGNCKWRKNHKYPAYSLRITGGN